MQFNVDPLPAFAREDTPVALYGRLRWMNGGARDRALAKDAIHRLCRQQAGDGVILIGRHRGFRRGKTGAEIR